MCSTWNDARSPFRDAQAPAIFSAYVRVSFLRRRVRIVSSQARAYAFPFIGG